MGFELNELSAAREVRLKPVHRSVDDAGGVKSIEEGGVTDGVEGRTQVEEDEDCE